MLYVPGEMLFLCLPELWTEGNSQCGSRSLFLRIRSLILEVPQSQVSTCHSGWPCQRKYPGCGCHWGGLITAPGNILMQSCIWGIEWPRATRSRVTVSKPHHGDVGLRTGQCGDRECRSVIALPTQRPAELLRLKRTPDPPSLCTPCCAPVVTERSRVCLVSS